MADQEADLSPKELQQLVMVLNCLKEGSLTVGCAYLLERDP